MDLNEWLVSQEWSQMKVLLESFGSFLAFDSSTWRPLSPKLPIELDMNQEESTPPEWLDCTNRRTWLHLSTIKALRSKASDFDGTFQEELVTGWAELTWVKCCRWPGRGKFAKKLHVRLMHYLSCCKPLVSRVLKRSYRGNSRIIRKRW